MDHERERDRLFDKIGVGLILGVVVSLILIGAAGVPWWTLFVIVPAVMFLVMLLGWTILDVFEPWWWWMWWRRGR